MFFSFAKQTQRITGTSLGKNPKNYSTTSNQSKQEASSRPSCFRPCVGAIIFNKEGRLLCGKRIDISLWQFPQGGMHPEEDPISAAVREVNEEIGLKPSQLLVIQNQHLPREKYTYHRPMYKDGKQYDGQEQRYVLFRWDGDISDCNLDPGLEPPEFSEIAWLTWDELIQRSVPSRTFIYARLRNTVKPLISEYLTQNKRIQGVELLPSGMIVTNSGPAAMSWGESLNPYKTSHLAFGENGFSPSTVGVNTPLTYFATSSIIPEIVTPSDRYITPLCPL